MKAAKKKMNTSRANAVGIGGGPKATERRSGQAKGHGAPTKAEINQHKAEMLGRVLGEMLETEGAKGHGITKLRHVLPEYGGQSFGDTEADKARILNILAGYADPSYYVALTVHRAHKGNTPRVVHTYVKIADEDVFKSIGRKEGGKKCELRTANSSAVNLRATSHDMRVGDVIGFVYVDEKTDEEQVKFRVVEEVILGKGIMAKEMEARGEE